MAPNTPVKFQSIRVIGVRVPGGRRIRSEEKEEEEEEEEELQRNQ